MQMHWTWVPLPPTMVQLIGSFLDGEGSVSFPLTGQTHGSLPRWLLPRADWKAQGWGLGIWVADGAIKVWIWQPRIHASCATKGLQPRKVLHSPLEMLTFHTSTWKITNTKSQNKVFHSGYQQGTDGSFKSGHFKEGLFTKGPCENVGKDKEYCGNLGLMAEQLPWLRLRRQEEGVVSGILKGTFWRREVVFA